MSKSALVVDTPRNCYDCESKSRPEWCPLKPLLEKMAGVAQTVHWGQHKSRLEWLY